MAHIQELSAHLADLIAAGEVVERPASVAKELIENAIDAGASQITVEIENGGISYLRITDNGCGIAPEDAPIAFRRHATSKLRTEADLSAIGTLGFRGEALAAICAVSHIDLLTKPKDLLAGIHLHLDGGKITGSEDAGCPDGTTFIIRDLFFNTPARMKFLKKDATEASYVLAVVQHAALSHPEIAFSLIRDHKQIFSSAGDGKLLTPVFGVFGREMTANLLEVQPYDRDAMCAWGYITKPHAGRPNRTMQHFFVNGRYIKNRTMQAALEEAYRNQIITGKYPSCTLFLTVPLHLVDVNVHPAKTEIKFAQEKEVFQIVYIACKNALMHDDNIPEWKAKVPSPKEDTVTSAQEELILPKAQAAPTPVQDKPAAVSPQPHAAATGRKPFRPPLIDCEDDFDMDTADKPSPSAPQNRKTADPTPAKFNDDVLAQPALTLTPPVTPIVVTETPPQAFIPASASAPVAETTEKTAEPPAAVPLPPQTQQSEVIAPAQFVPQVLGEAFHTYIVAEETDGSLLLIDKHAAHERMIFNQLRATTEIPQQELLSPLLVELSATESAVLQEHVEEVRQAGFDIAPFGAGSFAVRSAPAYLESADIPSVLAEIASKLSSGRNAVSDTLDDLIHTVACKAAIKGGSHSSLAELQSVCERVMQDPEITCCPHGRPVAVRLTKYEIDKLFKRVNQ